MRRFTGNIKSRRQKRKMIGTKKVYTLSSVLGGSELLEHSKACQNSARKRGDMPAPDFFESKAFLFQTGDFSRS